MQRIDGKQINFIITNELLEEVDRISKRTGQPRAETMRNLLDFGAEVYRDCEKIGLVKIVEITDLALKALHKNKGQQELFKEA